MKKIRKGFKEMVIYLLDDEAGKDKEIIDYYTDAFMGVLQPQCKCKNPMPFERNKLICWECIGFINK